METIRVAKRRHGVGSGFWRVAGGRRVTRAAMNQPQLATARALAQLITELPRELVTQSGARRFCLGGSTFSAGCGHGGESSIANRARPAQDELSTSALGTAGGSPA